MKRMKKVGIFPFVYLFVFLIIGAGLFQVSKSRTFQFFGGLVSRVNTEEKVIALTFDDGPTTHTETVLQILEDKQVKATFFFMGSQLEAYPDIGKRVASEGHEIGNHSYSHKRFLLRSLSFIDHEIQRTNALIRATGYKGGIHFRPPYGKKLFGLPWYLWRHNMKTIMVDVEPDTYGSQADFLVNYTLENTKPGSIILLHPFCDACNGQREAVGRIIDGLEATGYRFVTVSELLTYDEK